MDEPEKSPSGQNIYRYSEGQENKFEPASGDGENIEAISQHIEELIGPIEMVYHELVSDQVHIDVHWVKATDERPFHILVTSGMSDRAMQVPAEYEGVPRYLELCMLLPADWNLGSANMSPDDAFRDENNYWPIRWLKTVARFPHLYNTWIGYGHTIPNGEEAAPFASNTKLGCVLVLPSITLPEGFWSLKTDAKEINFFCLYPLYPEELDYKLKHGVDKLLNKFEAANIVDVIDPQRKNVCTGKRFLGLW